MRDTLDLIKEVNKHKYETADIKTAVNSLEDHLLELKKNPLVYSFDITTVLRNIGDGYRDLGEINQANDIYGEAMRLAKEDLNEIEEISVAASIANMEYRLGNIDKAFERIEKFKEIGKRRGDKLAEAKTDILVLLGNIYTEKGEYLKARKYFYLAIRTANGIKYKIGKLSALLGRGILDLKEGNYIRANKTLKTVLNRAKSQNRLLLPRLYYSISKASIGKGDVKSARKELEMARQCAKEYDLKLDIKTVGSL